MGRLCTISLNYIEVFPITLKLDLVLNFIILKSMNTGVRRGPILYHNNLLLVAAIV